MRLKFRFFIFFFLILKVGISQHIFFADNNMLIFNDKVVANSKQLKFIIKKIGNVELMNLYGKYNFIYKVNKTLNLIQTFIIFNSTTYDSGEPKINIKKLSGGFLLIIPSYYFQKKTNKLLHKLVMEYNFMQSNLD